MHVIYFNRASCFIKIYFEFLKKQALTTSGQIHFAQLMTLWSDAKESDDISFHLIHFLRPRVFSVHPFLTSWRGGARGVASVCVCVCVWGGGGGGMIQIT